MERTNEFDIKGMARTLGIHDYDIKLILGIPLEEVCEAETIASAHAEHSNAPANSEKEAVAWKKWNDFYLSDLDKAETLSEVKIIRKLCPSGSYCESKAMNKEISLCTKLEEINMLKNLVLIHANSRAHKTYLKRKLELSNTLSELKELVEECPTGAEIIIEVNEKWHIVSNWEIAKVKNFQYMESIFYDLSPRSRSRSLFKWLEVCANALEIQKLHHLLFGKRAPYLICDNSFLQNMYSKWVEFSSAEIKVAKDFKEAMAAQGCTPENSKIRIEATEKCLALADNFDLIREVYIYAPNNYELKMKIFWKWLLFTTGVAEAKTLYVFFTDKSPRPEDKCQEYVVLDKAEIMTAITKKVAYFYGYQEK